MANINDELNQIKNAVYGKDVRGSIHDGIDKINKETEVATTKSNEAYDITQNLLDDSFDQGALNTNIEQKLSDLETLYAPKLTGLQSQLLYEAFERIVREKNNYHGYYENAVVSFAFDDASIADWTKFKIIFESEDVPGNVCVVIDWVGRTEPYQNMTWDQLKILKKMGWTVASHTVSHRRLAELTEAEIDYEFGESSRILQENGLDHDIIVYPFGDTSEVALRIARKYYKMGINIVRYNLSNEIPHLDNLNMVRVPGLSHKKDNGIEPTLAECKAIVDDAIANGKYIIFEDHAGYAIYNNPEKLDELRQLIQYIKSKGVPIVNLQDGFNMKCNVVDTWVNSNNYYRLHRNGKVSQSDLSFYNQSRTGTTYRDLPPKDFQLGKITVDRIAGDLANVEEAYKATFLRYTHKMLDAPNSWYQEIQSPNGYFIRWAVDQNTWGSLIKINNFVDINERSGTSYDLPPSEFKNNKVTVDRLARKLDHPLEAYRENSIRYTHKETEAPNTWFQEIFNPNGIYFRFASTTGDSWGEFKKIEFGNNIKFQRLESSQFTVNAQSTYDLEINAPGLYFTDQVTITPYNFSNIPIGVFSSVYKIADNKVTLRFANITSSSISVPAISWALTTQRRL